MKEVAVLKPHVIIEQLPRAILQVFSLQLKGNNPSKEVPNADLSEVDISLVNSLLSFQREGVKYDYFNFFSRFHFVLYTLELLSMFRVRFKVEITISS